MAWIDITAEANWSPMTAFGGGSHFPGAPSPPWFYEPNQGVWYDCADSTSANGVYYEFVGGIWTPTHVIGSAPIGDMIPCLAYVGATYADLADVRITVRNRADVSGPWYYGPFDNGTAVPAGFYASGTELVLSFGDFGRSNEFDDITGGDIYQLLNRIYSIAATHDADFLHFANSPRVLFDIVKIEIDATPLSGFWTDFTGCLES